MSKRLVTDEQIIRAIQEHGSTRKAARALGVDQATVGRRAKKLREAIFARALANNAERMIAGSLSSEPCQPSSASDVNGEQPSAFDKRLVGLQDENTRLKAELKKAVRAELAAEKVRTEIFGVAEHSPMPPDWLCVNLAERDHSGPGTPMVMWSDWHWAEVVKQNEVGGVNQFNLEIAHARLKRLVSKTIKLAFNHQVVGANGYPGIVVFLGGDMIGGEIHGELADTNELKTIPALWDLADALTAALKELADKFGRVFVSGVVGNHGRNTLKPRAKSRVETSYEWLLYVMLERFFANDPRVQFFIPNDIDALIRVNGTRYLLTHGDSLGVKGGDGIIGALGPIMRGRIKVGHAQAQIGRDFDVMVIGHWHQYLPLPNVIVNGSLKGYDEYARTYLRAPFQVPIQAMWYDHPLVGITKHEPIYLENQRQLTPLDGWVSWVKE